MRALSEKHRMNRQTVSHVIEKRQRGDGDGIPGQLLRRGPTAGRDEQPGGSCEALLKVADAVRYGAEVERAV